MGSPRTCSTWLKQTDTLWGVISILWLEIRKRTFASLQILGVKEASIPKLLSRGLETFVHLVPWQKGSTCGIPAEMMWPQVEKTEIIHGLSVSPAGNLTVLICADSDLIKSIKTQYFKNYSGCVEQHPPPWRKSISSPNCFSSGTGFGHQRWFSGVGDDGSLLISNPSALSSGHCQSHTHLAHCQ